MSNGLDGVIAAATILSHADRPGETVWMRRHDLPIQVAQHGFRKDLLRGFRCGAEVQVSIAAPQVR